MADSGYPINYPSYRTPLRGKQYSGIELAGYMSAILPLSPVQLFVNIPLFKGEIVQLIYSEPPGLALLVYFTATASEVHQLGSGNSRGEL